MRDETEYPRLTPPDDSYHASGGLLRRPEELTDDQFDLLAAGWSEGALSGEQLSELEEALTASPARRIRAESFKKVKLVPYGERWPGRNRMLKQSPAYMAVRRTLIITASAAAAVAVIMLGPAALRRAAETRITSLPESAVMAEAKTEPIPESAVMAEAKTEPIPENTVIAEVLIPEARPVIIPAMPAESASAEPSKGETVRGEPVMAESKQEIIMTREAVPIAADMNPAAETPVLITASAHAVLRPVELNPVTSTLHQGPASDEIPDAGKESNWILRGVSALAKAITGEEKKIDSYFIASACVRGINNTLGWEMELKKTSTPDGEPVAVNFSSSLLTVSAPVNKNSP